MGATLSLLPRRNFEFFFSLPLRSTVIKCPENRVSWTAARVSKTVGVNVRKRPSQKSRRVASLLASPCSLLPRTWIYGEKMSSLSSVFAPSSVRESCRQTARERPLVSSWPLLLLLSSFLIVSHDLSCFSNSHMAALEDLFFFCLFCPLCHHPPHLALCLTNILLKKKDPLSKDKLFLSFPLLPPPPIDAHTDVFICPLQSCARLTFVPLFFFYSKAKCVFSLFGSGRSL